MWHVYDSPSWELSQSHWVLGPGSHSGGTDFDDNAVSSIRQISDTCKSNIITPTNVGYVFTLSGYLYVPGVG